MTRDFFRGFSRSGPFWVFVSFLLATFLMGGGARSDVMSLVVLRPLAAVALGFGLWGLTAEALRPYRSIMLILVVSTLLVLAHLIPLPPSIWSLLPGRELIARIDQAAGLGDVWRPLSLAPSQSWNALFSLIVPFAILLLAARFGREQRFRLLPIMIGLGAFSGLLGLFQVIGPADGPLYFYKVTNNGSAVGLFANRNHQAVFLACMFPLLAVYASTSLRSPRQARIKLGIAIGMGVFLIPLILVAGSRAGLILAFVGLASVPLLYRHPVFAKPAQAAKKGKSPQYAYAALGVGGLGLITLLAARAEALQRLLNTSATSEIRLGYWKPTLEMIEKYFPFGSGLGSFIEVFQVDEPLGMLGPSYANHAHNDLLEIAMTGGLPALLILASAIAIWAWGSFYLFFQAGKRGRDEIFGRLGAIILFLMGLASIVDYPIRTPSLVAFTVLAATWMAAGCNSRSSTANSSDRKLMELQEALG